MVAQRDSRGRFLPGHSGGPGRPPREVEADYLHTMSQVATLDAWRDICERAVEDARNGDAKAREWLSRHLVMATARVEVEHHGDGAKFGPEVLIAIQQLGEEAARHKKPQIVDEAYIESLFETNASNT